MKINKSKQLSKATESLAAKRPASPKLADAPDKLKDKMEVSKRKGVDSLNRDHSDSIRDRTKR